MSGKFSTAVVLASLVAIAFAANRAEESAAGVDSSRGPASVVDEKDVVLGSFRDAPDGVSHTEKIQGPLKVSLMSPDSAASDTFRVVATLSTRKDLVGGVDYSWSVPAGLEMVSGSEQGHVDRLSISAPVKFSATFHKTVTGNLQIHLLAKAHNPGLRFAQVAQFNTEAGVPEPTTATAETKSVTVFH